MRRVGFGSRRYLRARGRRRVGPAAAEGEEVEGGLEERWAWASGAETGTVLVEMWVWPAKV